MTILRGEGVFQGKIPKPYWNFQWCFFWGVGGGGGSEEGVVQSYSKNFFVQGFEYFLEREYCGALNLLL